MSTVNTNDRLTASWLKFGGATALVFFACWGGAIAYWRTTGRNPATADLAISMFGLPLVLLLAFFIGHKFVAQRKAVQHPAIAATAAKANPTPSQQAQLALLAASLRLPHGASPEELTESIANDKARADLDKDLRDDDGFPILSMRSGEAEDEALQDEIMQWQAARGMAEISFSEEQWRALTLATGVAGEMAGQAASLPLRREPHPFTLILVPILPAEWGIEKRQAGAEWLKHVMVQCGWPADQIALSGTLADTDPPSTTLNSLAGKIAAANNPSIAMVIACGSAIGDHTVSEWASDGTLFTPSQPRGRIPGEGAVALLVTDGQRARSIEGRPYALLETIETARRDTSVDETRRTDSAVLGKLIEHSLQSGGIALPDVGMVIADTGQRANRVAELMGHLSAAMPKLDYKEDVLRVGAACGSCDAVPLIAALALARHYAIERGAKVLCVSNEDPFQRAVGLVRGAG